MAFAVSLQKMNTSELEELYQQHFVTLFPFHLNYVEQILEFNKIEIVPGIFIEKCDHKHIGSLTIFGDHAHSQN